MKRLLIRMSALATVVALGLFAIAQAQRSAEDPSSEAQTFQEDGPGSVLAPLEHRRPEPMVTEVEASHAPGLFPAAPRVNPLRPEDRLDFRGDVGDGGDVVPAAAISGRRYPAEIGTAELIHAGQPSSAGSQDLFAPVPAAGAGIPATGIPAAQSEYEQFPTRPETFPTTISDDLRPDGAPALVGPEGSGASALRPPVEPRQVESLVGGRYGTATVSTPNSHEPGRLQLDQRVPSSSIPNPAGDSVGGFGLPETLPLPNDVGKGSQGTGAPGNRQLEGPQRPQLTIQKFAPQEIQVGGEATFRVKVVNVGEVAAHGVEIRDEIPRGTRLVGTSPQSSPGARGELVWTLGTLRPGDEASVEVRLMPLEEGEIGSVATVHFGADASVRTRVTKPELALNISAPSQVLIGQEAGLTITISNPGSGVASGVVLEAHVPPGFQHPAGAELEYTIGDLKPNESRQLELELLAVQAGPVSNVLTARADANLKVDDRVDIEILAPQLDVALDGPKRRYLEREATYTLAVTNPGTAPARNVELVAYLPPGLKFVSANNSGQYEPASRTVHWNLDELPVQETGVVRLTAMPVEAGEQVIRFAGTAEPGLAAGGEQPVLVEGIAAIMFQVADVDDPIELGGETTYEIRVVNQGSKAATNVQIEVLLPSEMRPVAAEGPASYAIDGNRVLFESLPRLAPKADTTYRVRVQGLQPGDLRLRVRLLTDEMTTPVTKEESTRVYSDE